MICQNMYPICQHHLIESQGPTQRYGRRPFGVGLLIAGYDVYFTKLYIYTKALYLHTSSTSTHKLYIYT